MSSRLLCTVKGSAELHVTWFLNDKPLSSSEKHKISFKAGQATLEIINLSESDSGNYTCEVMNEAGCESCTSQVTVKGNTQDSYILIYCSLHCDRRVILNLIALTVFRTSCI